MFVGRPSACWPCPSACFGHVAARPRTARDMDSPTLHSVNETVPSWDTVSAWSMGCGAARTSTLQVLVLTFILIISSTVAGPIIAQLTCSHKLVGYMLLGFVCTERMLDMIVTAHALDDLKWVMVLCKAFTAFETATQLASAGELKYYVKSVSFAAVSHVAACFGAGLLVVLALLSTQGLATVSDCNSQPIGTPAPVYNSRPIASRQPSVTVRRCPRARWWLCDGDGRCHWSGCDGCRAEHICGHRNRGACAGTDTDTH